MNKLELKGTKYTPEIIMDADSGVITITGKSYPENTFKFYQPVSEWLENYLENTTNDKTIVNLDLPYFNSSSSKFFFDFLDLLDDAKESDKIEVNWIYHQDNHSAEEIGQDFIEDFEDLTINLVMKN